MLMILFVYGVYSIWRMEKRRKGDEQTRWNYISSLTTIIIAVIANALTLNAQIHQESQDLHEGLTEKFTYSYIKPIETLKEEAITNGEGDDIIGIPIQIDVRTGELYRFLILNYKDDMIKEIIQENVAEFATGIHDSEQIERTIELRLNRKEEHQDPVRLTCYVLVEGMDNSKNLDMLQFVLNGKSEITDWEVFHENVLFGFNTLSDEYKIKFSEYKQLYDSIIGNNI